MGELRYWNDKLCPSDRDVSDLDIQRRAECLDTSSALTNEQRAGGRDQDVRLFLGGGFDVAVNRRISVYGRLEFLPFQFDQRVAFRDDVNNVFSQRDPLVYGQLGVTLKM